jgi:hypothetical protein
MIRWILLFWIALPAGAQSYGYLFAGVGSESGAYGRGFTYVGAGAEGRFLRVLGAGGEIGLIARDRSFVMAASNVSAHLPVHTKVDPFVTAGWGIGTNASSAYDFLNVGGGLNVWVRPRLGIRLEVRDFLWRGESRHLVGFRAGIVFR